MSRCQETITTTSTTRHVVQSGDAPARTRFYTVWVINSRSYVTTIPAILKIAQVVCGVICFSLLFSLRPQLAVAFSVSPPAHEINFLRLVSFFCWLLTLLMLLTSLLSQQTAILLPRTCLDFVFHLLAVVFYFDGGLSIFIALGKIASHVPGIIASAVFAMICCVLHAIHGTLSFRVWRANLCA